MTTPGAAQGDASSWRAPVHFVGAGGRGMSAIARILLARGIAVSGSDAKDSVYLEALRALGAQVWVGHDAGHVSGAGTVVVSTAIKEGNPELAAARVAGLPVLRRAEALAVLMQGRRTGLIAGTHGKTTTTSMLTVAAQHCGADPSFAIGGQLNETGVNAHDGSGDLFIAETDESDESFLLFRADVAVITNVEADHMDHFADVADVERAFLAFTERVDPAGLLISCTDDPGAERVAAIAAARGVSVQRYGLDPTADLRLENLTLSPLGSEWTPVLNGRRLATVSLRVPGVHNALNAAGALAAGLALGLPEAGLRDGLAGFTGARRRFEVRGSAAGVRVVDDYAHHPTEIAVTLEAARRYAGSGKVIATFQAQRYSRVAAFRREFGEALGKADVVVVMEIDPSGETPIPGGSGAAIAAEVPLPADQVVFEPSWSAVAGRLAAAAAPGDVVLTIGSGDVTMIGPEVLRLLAEAEQS
jgi:UDP-N-acetylmuramate--alanine ligase